MLVKNRFKSPEYTSEHLTGNAAPILSLKKKIQIHPGVELKFP